MVEQCVEPFLEQRQPIFHARQSATIANSLVKRVLRGRCAEHLAVAAAETLDAVGIE